MNVYNIYNVSYTMSINVHIIKYILFDIINNAYNIIKFNSWPARKSVHSTLDTYMYPGTCTAIMVSIHVLLEYWLQQQ